MFPTDESFTLSWTKEESLQRKHPEARVLFPFVIFFILCVFIKKAMKAARMGKGFSTNNKRNDPFDDRAISQLS